MKRHNKIILIISLITLSVSSGMVFQNKVFSAKATDTVNITDTLSIMGENSPINILILDRINQIEKENMMILLNEKKAQIEAKRILEEEERLALLKKVPNAKFAYLTFDDGPSLNATPEILKILDEYNIKATFFVVGYMVDRHPEILRQIQSSGHAIGNHSYSHNYKYIYRNSKNFMEDINKNDGAIKNVLGQDYEIKLLRFPGGSTGKNKAPMIRAAEKEGYSIYDWNSLNGDAEGLNLKNSYLTKRFKETVGNKKNVIVLMHDIDSKRGTVDTLRENIEYLVKRGYNFRTLEEKEN